MGWLSVLRTLLVISAAAHLIWEIVQVPLYTIWWTGTMDDPVGFLAERGWQATLTQAGAPDANHGRWTLPVIPTTMPNIPHNWFVTAEKN